MSELNIKTLLPELQKQVALLSEDLLERCTTNAEVNAGLRAAFDQSKEGGRTAESFEVWREDYLDQVAVAWVLACVFVRFMEDNGLIDECYLAGEGDRRKLAEDTHELYFREHPHESDREYFEHVFREVGKLPACADMFAKEKTLLWAVGPTGDAAMKLLAFWREIDAEGGHLKRSFQSSEDSDQSGTSLATDHRSLNTRFLGDLYQDLSERARKKYALLQTPVFIEEFILDRTLTPAIDTFGLEQVRMIDPTCGSGHFCLGGFERLFRLWMQRENNEIAAAQKALDSVWGVDLNPFAVAIARFRLIVAAMNACGIRRLKEAPAWRINLAVGDSLLHGRRFGEFEMQGAQQRTFDTEEVFRDELKHHYQVEDVEALHRILGQQYHAVVGNPPYITVKDRAVSELYRARYPSCHRKYSLSVPFMERFFDLAVKGDGTPQQPAGLVGQITANSFMKCEFGKKLIQEFIPKWDLTHVLDTDKAHIPGHATGTVILLGRNRPPVSTLVRVAMGIRKQEPAPENAANGLFWLSLLKQVDHAGSETEWLSVTDVERSRLQRHPWSIGGGGAAELKALIDENTDKTLGNLTESVGFSSIMAEDDAFQYPLGHWLLSNVPSGNRRLYVIGEDVRDWQWSPVCEVLFPYDQEVELTEVPSIIRSLWPYRTVLWDRPDFSGKSYRERGRTYFEYHQIPKKRNTLDRNITFSKLATQNNFALVRGPVLLNGYAPLVSLPTDATEADHEVLLGTLNSSLASFWLKQVCQDRGAGGIGGGISAEAWEHRFEYGGTKVEQCPLPPHSPRQLPTALVQTSTALQGQSPAATLASWGGPESGDLRPWLASARDLGTRHRRQLIAWQEELDWQIYEAFGLVEGAAESTTTAVSLPEGVAVDAIPPEGIELGQRAFEIMLARRMAAGEVQTTWFERHGSTPITEIPSHWPAAYQELVEHRIARIESDPNIRLIEQPEYKRRWNTEPWDKQLERAIREALLLRLEQYFFGGERMAQNQNDVAAKSGDYMAKLRSSFIAGREPALVSVSQLADVVHGDPYFLELAAIYRGRQDFNLAALITELVESESVPFLPVLRYKPTGLRTRELWERTWDLQREEDRIDAEIARLKAEIDQRLTELIQKERPDVVRTAAAAKEKLDQAEAAFHEKHHPGKPYDGENPYWAMKSIPPDQLGDVVELKELAKAEVAAKHVVAVARGELARGNKEVNALEEQLEALKKPEVPVPPKYGSTDFVRSDYWRLRGKLDVPKERWVSYPRCESDGDPSLVIAWAGWDHLQQATALVAHYDARKREGWTAERLTPLLAGLDQLLPWIHQWHPEVHPEFGETAGKSFQTMLTQDAHELGLTLDAIRAWEPPAKVRKQKKVKAKEHD